MYHKGVLLLTADKSDFHTRFLAHSCSKPTLFMKAVIMDIGFKKNLINIYLRKFDYDKNTR